MFEGFRERRHAAGALRPQQGADLIRGQDSPRMHLEDALPVELDRAQVTQAQREGQGTGAVAIRWGFDAQQIDGLRQRQQPPAQRDGDRLQIEGQRRRGAVRQPLHQGGGPGSALRRAQHPLEPHAIAGVRPAQRQQAAEHRQDRGIVVARHALAQGPGAACRGGLQGAVPVSSRNASGSISSCPISALSRCPR